MDKPVDGEPTHELSAAAGSYQRCSANPDFLRDFYSTFFATCPEAEQRFSDTDFELQYRLLRHAIGLLLVFPKQRDGDPSLLRRVAERHSRRDLNIDPSLYPPFVDSLIATVKQHDPEFDAGIEHAWRMTLAKGVEYMISKY